MARRGTQTTTMSEVQGATTFPRETSGFV